jgi:hypothetical protein
MDALALHFMQVVGRLKPGVTLAAMQSDMPTMAAELHYNRVTLGAQSGTRLGVDEIAAPRGKGKWGRSIGRQTLGRQGLANPSGRIFIAS